MPAVASEMQAPKKRVLIGSVGILQAVLRSPLGHFEPFPPPRLNDRYLFS
jgi:hypothetical protein